MEANSICDKLLHMQNMFTAQDLDCSRDANMHIKRIPALAHYFFVIFFSCAFQLFFLFAKKYKNNVSWKLVKFFDCNKPRMINITVFLLVNYKISLELLETSRRLSFSRFNKLKRQKKSDSCLSVCICLYSCVFLYSFFSLSLPFCH